MIPVTKPTDDVVLEVLKGFLKRTYTRDDIYGWQKEIREHFAENHPGCVSILAESKSGNFIVQSLAFINDKGIASFEDEETYFIRDDDIEEYALELTCVDCKEKNGTIERVRGHQIAPIEETKHPLVCISSCDGEIIKRFKIFFTRGIVDDLAEHVEYANIKYKDTGFYLQYNHRQRDHQLTIFGFKGSDDPLAGMLADLDVSFQGLSWVNDDMFPGKTELWRRDDNGNVFRITEYDYRLEAELKRKEFEGKRHKQTYFLKSKFD